MRSARNVWLASALALLFAAGGVHAQVAAEEAVSESAPVTVEDVLHAMTQQAAVIFAGQVVAVRRLSGRDGSTGVVEISFAVDDAVRGVSGSSYTLREWAGLWTGGDQPLRAGQRYLMLLYAPSATGLSSPVGGMDGAIPIRGGEPAQAKLGRGTRAPGVYAPVSGSMTRGHTIDLRAANLRASDLRTSDLRTGDPRADLRTVDLRWIATRVVRPVSYFLTVAHPTALPVSVHAEAVTATESTGGAASGNAVSPADEEIAAGAEHADYTTVLALLRSWASAGDAAR